MDQLLKCRVWLDQVFAYFCSTELKREASLAHSYILVLKELKLIPGIGGVVVLILTMMVMVVFGRGMLFLLMVVGHHAVGKHHSVSSH
jgi:hypothetical protein